MPKVPPSHKPFGDSRPAASQYDHGFFNTAIWRKLRLLVLYRDKGICQRCGAAVGLSGHVDHKKDRKTHPHLALVLSNLWTLCDRCHGQKTRGVDLEKSDGSGR